MIDKQKLRLTVWRSWLFTLMGVFNIVVLLFLASLIAIRFRGPAAIVAIIMPTFAFMTLVFLLGEPIVNFIFQAEKPHPERDKRFIDSLERMRKKARLWIRPRGWIVNIGMPNAMAYGPGIPGLCAVGVSRELMDIMTDDELDGIVAHELAHIKCRDTGILALIGLIMSLLDKLRHLVSEKQALAMQSPIMVAAAWVVYGIGKAAFYISKFSISQEREIAADALGASYQGSPDPLISALTKLHNRRSTTENEKPLMHDLMVSHPGLEERIASLRGITTPALIESKGVLS